MTNYFKQYRGELYEHVKPYILGGGDADDENTRMIDELKKQLAEKDKKINELQKINETQKMSNQQIANLLLKQEQQYRHLQARKERKQKSLDTYNALSINRRYKVKNDELLTNPALKNQNEFTAFDRINNNDAGYNTYNITFKSYQKNFIDTFTQNTNPLTILHYGVGTGKTFIAVCCAQEYINLQGIDNAYVYFVTPPSLVLNTMSDMMKLGIPFDLKNSNDEYVFHYISFNQLLLSKLQFKKNSLLIIDEVHNLRNFKTQNNTEKLSARKRKRGENFRMTGNKTAIKIILEANKEQAIKKTLFMTGTLMINSVNDLDSIMALGYMKPPLLNNFEDKWYNIVGPPYTPLKLDEKKYDQSYTQLNQYFSGVISTYFAPTDDPQYPTVKYKFVYVNKDNTKDITTDIYDSIIKNLNTRTDIKRKENYIKDLRDTTRGIYSSIKGRIEPEANDNNDVKYEDEEYIKDDIEDINTNMDNFDDMQEGDGKKLVEMDADTGDAYYYYSRNEYGMMKIEYIINILKSKTRPKNTRTLIYFQFINLAIQPLLEVLKAEGINFVVITGSDNAKEKLEKVNKYNNYEVDLLIFSIAIKEGISFKETDEFYFCNLYFNYPIMEQILARGIRVNSHKKGKDAILKIFILLGVDNDKIEKHKKQLDYIESAFNKGIKTVLEVPSDLMESKNIDGVLVQHKHDFGNSGDLKMLSFVFFKQVDINNMNYKLIKYSLPFEKANDIFSSEFNEAYTKAIITKQEELKRELTIKEKIQAKKIIYDVFYNKQLNNLLTSNIDLSKYSSTRNPDLETEAKKYNISDEIIRKYKGDIKLIFDDPEIKLSKQYITTFQANFTPYTECVELIKYSGILDNNNAPLRILEPTAGVGNMIIPLLESKNKFNYEIDLNEYNHLFVQIAKYKFENISNIVIHETDFFKYTPSYQYDYILGNPPFNLPGQRTEYKKTKNKVTGEINQYVDKYDVVYYDVDFVTEAYNTLLKMGGVLCMIISADAVNPETQRKARARFQEDLKQLQSMDENNVKYEKSNQFNKDGSIDNKMTTAYPMVKIWLRKVENFMFITNDKDEKKIIRAEKREMKKKEEEIMSAEETEKQTKKQADDEAKKNENINKKYIMFLETLNTLDANVEVIKDLKNIIKEATEIQDEFEQETNENEKNILNEEMKDLSKEVKSIKTNNKDTQILITKLASELNKKMKDFNKEDEDDKKTYNDIMKQTEEIMKNIKKPQTTKDIYAPTRSKYNESYMQPAYHKSDTEEDIRDMNIKMDIVDKEIKEYNKNKEKNIDKALDMLLYSGSVLRDINNKLRRSYDLDMYDLKQYEQQLINIKYDDDEDSDYNKILKTVRPYLLNIIETKISKIKKNKILL